MICISVELVGPIAVSVRGPLISYRSIGGGFDFGNRQVGRHAHCPLKTGGQRRYAHFPPGQVGTTCWPVRHLLVSAAAAAEVGQLVEVLLLLPHVPVQALCQRVEPVADLILQQNSNDVFQLKMT